MQDVLKSSLNAFKACTMCGYTSKHVYWVLVDFSRVSQTKVCTRKINLTLKNNILAPRKTFFIIFRQLNRKNDFSESLRSPMGLRPLFFFGFMSLPSHSSSLSSFFFLLPGPLLFSLDSLFRGSRIKMRGNGGRSTSALLSLSSLKTGTRVVF